MYALMMSTLNLGNMAAHQLGALLLWALGITQTDYSRLWLALLITNTSTLLPLLLINDVEFDNIQVQRTRGEE